MNPWAIKDCKIKIKVFVVFSLHEFEKYLYKVTLVIEHATCILKGVKTYILYCNCMLIKLICS
jgi:hypothetical protein